MDKIMKNVVKNKDIIKYLIAGVFTTVISLLVYYLCATTFLNPNDPVELQISNIISWVCAVIFAYIVNRKYVFESKNNNYLKEITSFVSSRIITLLLDMGIMFTLVSVLNLNDKLAKLIVQVIIVILNYVFSKLFVFRKDKYEKN